MLADERPLFSPSTPCERFRAAATPVTARSRNSKEHNHLHQQQTFSDHGSEVSTCTTRNTLVKLIVRHDLECKRSSGLNKPGPIEAPLS